MARLAIQYNTPPTHALVYVKRPVTQLRGGPCSANVGGNATYGHQATQA